MPLARPPVLVLSGIAATTVIALTSGLAPHPALAAMADRLPSPLWLVILAAMMATYGLGLGLGWIFWGRR